jgi:hypothetical protein
MFDKPVKLLPHSTRALYCHSSLPDDLGIQYQSYGKHDIVAEDEYLVVRPGLGHTGAEPFDEVQGWYRAYRALAGNLSYTVRRKGWTPFEHKIFPEPLKQAVKTLLMCQNQDHFLRSRSASIEGGTPSLSRQPSSGSSAPVSPLVAHRVNRSNSDCKGSTGGGNEDEQPVQKLSGDDPSYVPPFAPQAAAVVNPVGAPSSSLAAGAGPSDGGRSDRAKDLAAAVMQNLREACRGRRISELPVFVIYHILEYLVCAPAFGCCGTQCLDRSCSCCCSTGTGSRRATTTTRMIHPLAWYRTDRCRSFAQHTHRIPLPVHGYSGAISAEEAER